MAWTFPKTWTGVLVTISDLNTHIRDNMLALLPGGAAGTNVAHAAGNFTGNNSMTWTVASGDQITFRYLEVGKKMTIWLYLSFTTVGGTPSTQLQVAVPNGKTIAVTTRGPFAGTDNGTDVNSFYEATAGATVIKFFRNGTPSAWAASTNNSAIFASFEIEVV